jgi:hypothetical protein
MEKYLQKGEEYFQFPGTKSPFVLEDGSRLIVNQIDEGTTWIQVYPNGERKQHIIKSKAETSVDRKNVPRLTEGYTYEKEGDVEILICPDGRRKNVTGIPHYFVEEWHNKTKEIVSTQLCCTCFGGTDAQKQSKEMWSCYRQFFGIKSDS